MIQSISDFIVDVSVKSRNFVVTGPRGTLTRLMRHVHADIRKVEDGKVRVDVWHGSRKDIAKINTTCSVLRNMITGVTRGFRYKLRFVYAHFPINVTCSDDKKSCEIRNFLGEKRVRKVAMTGDVVCYRSEGVKDELIVEGSDVEQVSQCAAMVHHVCKYFTPFSEITLYRELAPLPSCTILTNPIVSSISWDSSSGLVKKKDIRKFLDGIYVSNKGHIVVEE